MLRIENLSIAFQSHAGSRAVVEGVNLAIRRGEIAALVGESGSGKTLLARSIVDLMPPGAVVTSGEIWFDGKAMVAAGPGGRLALRGRHVGQIFQEPLSSLNPALRAGVQLTEALRFHRGFSAEEARNEALAMLERVQIAAPDTVMRSYPHELSGGMRQRVMIAAALILQPALLIADEPTTALDMIVQNEVLTLLREATAATGTAVLLVTHDLGAVASLADTVNVMNSGRIVERGEVAAILEAPHDPYTRKLLAAFPQPKTEITPPPVGNASALLEVRNLCVAFSEPRGARTTVVDNVSFSIRPGETLAIIGQSGSGKTTLSRAIAGLQKVTSGDILFRGRRTEEIRRGEGAPMQFVFQDSFGSLDPRMTVGAIVGEALLFDPRCDPVSRRKKVARALEDVRLGAAFADRFPHQLSGGQRQRVSIARAIIREPDFIIADEPVSALDLTVQARILELFLDLKARLGFACLFVSHDLGIVEHFADRVGVLHRGRLIEIAPCSVLFSCPHHAYTRALLEASPHLIARPEGGYRLARRAFTDAAHPPTGLTGSTPEDASGYVMVGPGHFVFLAA